MRVAIWAGAVALLGAPATCQSQGSSSADSIDASPISSGIGWEAAFEKAKAFVSKLSLDEKVYLITGNTGPCVGNIGPVPRLKFRGLCLSDGPLGIRQATKVSTFPAGVNVAAAWDRSLARLRGVQMGQEHKAKGSHLAYGPVVGPLGKQALGGRNWEGFSVDPYLTGAMAEETVTGLQSAGVQACTKHFVGNEQDTSRLGLNGATTLSSNIDDQTIHELYLWPFANAVRAGTASIMCSYNRLNGTFSCENSKSMNGYLKREMGFQGHVLSDYGAQRSGARAANAGLDVGMPGGNLVILSEPSFFRDNLANDVRQGRVSRARINDMCRRFMTPYFLLGQDSADFPYVDETNGDGSLYLSQNQTIRNALIGGKSGRNVQANHAQSIRQLGAASTILLKNEGNVLPLTKPRSIGVFANDAGAKLGPLQNSANYYYGTLPVGGGSGTGNLPYVVDPLAALKARASRDGTKVSDFQDNFLLASGAVGPGTFLGLNITEPPDVCLVFLKTWQMEAQDRTNLTTDWAGDAVVDKVASRCPKTVVVTHSGGANTLPWASNPNVKAILLAHYPGQEIGNSIVDVLYGAVNPSGHLPYTVANLQSDYNTHIVNPPSFDDNFNERMLVDYRYFDATNKQVAFPFGFGLSYTSFAISGVSGFSAAGAARIPAAPPAAAIRPGGNPRLWDAVYTVTATVKNTGSMAGAAVPQLYLSLGKNAPAGHPIRQLRGFDKISLGPGEAKSVTFQLLRRDVSYWDTVRQQWIVPAGQMTAWVGQHSRDLKQSTSFSLV